MEPYPLCTKIKKSYKSNQNDKYILNPAQKSFLFSGLLLFHDDSSVLYKS